MSRPTNTGTHDTLNTFRKRFLPQIEGLMVQVLLIAQAMKLVSLGHIALDGTKVKANASRHSALSYGHSQKLEQQLREEVARLLALAETADNAAVPDGMSLPEEISRREDRLSAIAQAKAKIEARARERFEQEQVVYQAKLARRAAKSKEAGKPPRGQPPTPPCSGARDKDQINLTDEESRIMKVSGGGFEQCYNAENRRGHGQPADRGYEHRAGGQRQTANRTDAIAARGLTARASAT